MILNEPQAALSELIETLHESMDDYEDNLQRVHQPEIAQVFNSAMNQRAQRVSILEEAARQQLGLRPKAADTEREDFHHLWSKLKSLVFDEQALMLNESAEQERQLISLIARCQSYDYPDPIGDILTNLHQEVDDQLSQIKRLQQA